VKWVHSDPEEGLYVDEFGGTFISERTGRTLAEEFPESYWQVSDWRAAILIIAERFHGWARGLCKRKTAERVTR
jgi:hypothetical protein